MLGWEDVANSLWSIKTSWRKGVALRQMEDACEAVLFGRGRRKTCLLFNKKLLNGFLIIFLFTPPLCNFLLISWIADWKWLFHPWGIPRELSNAGLFSEAVGNRSWGTQDMSTAMSQKSHWCSPPVLLHHPLCTCPMRCWTFQPPKPHTSLLQYVLKFTATSTHLISHLQCALCTNLKTQIRFREHKEQQLSDATKY